MIAGIVNDHGNRGQGHRCVSQQNGGELVAPAADAIRSFHHGFANHPAHGERRIADDDAGHNFKGGVKDQSRGCSTDAVEKRSRVRRVRIRGQRSTRNLGTRTTSDRPVHTVVISGDGLMTEVAMIAFRRSSILCRAELRCGIAGTITHTVTHGRER